MAAERASRRQLLRWAGWFGAANAGVFALILSRYLWYYPFTNDLVAIVYVVLAFVGHAAVLAIAPLFLIVAPLVAVLPARRPVTVVAVFVTSVLAGLLILDSNVFAQNRYHLTWLTFEIMEWHTFAFAGVFFLIALMFESLLSGIVWRRLSAGSMPMRGRWLGVGLGTCLLVSQLLHVWGDAVGHTPVIQFSRYLPAYRAFTAKRTLGRLGLVDPERVRQRRLLSRSVGAGDGELKYPLQPMNCRADTDSLPNIVIVMLDALRPDAIHPDLMPRLSEFRRNASHFTRHYSGGNGTRIGVFSLFYGVPGTYWQSFYASQRSPVLMDQIRDHGYQAGLFSAIGFGSPMSADRTIFVWWPGLPGRTDLTNLRAQNPQATDDWLEWLAESNDDQPIFGYLHYSPPNKEMSSEKPLGEPLPMEDRYQGNTEAEDAWLRYRKSMQTLDHEFGRVLDSLESRSLLDNTIVIVASDHGNEFDDNGLGYMGNGTAFSNAQLVSTLTIGWPGREPAEYRHRTSHYDLPVTLLQDVFGCDNPPRDYSIGRNLYAGESWTWIIAGSYSAHAIVEPERVIISHPGGYVEARDRNYRPVSGLDLNPVVIREAMESQGRFYK